MIANRAGYRMLCLLGVAALSLAGCPQGQSEPPSTAWWGGSDTSPRPADGTSVSSQEPSGGGLFSGLFSPGASGDAEDGNYTILLAVCRGPGSHIAQAKYYKQATEKHAGWKHLFIVHKEDHSLLYSGKYRTVDDARPHLKEAKTYVTPAKVKVYAKAIIVPIPGNENPGPPEWDLAKAPEQYVYTVLLAAFYDVLEADYIGRRKFAVDYCKQLRDEGVPAYFKHDPAQSIVTVGLYEKTAVDVLRSDQKIQRIVRDPQINNVFKRFPYVALNGRQQLVSTVNAQTGRVTQTPVPTYLIRVPREKPSNEDIIWVTPTPGPRNAKSGQAPGDTTGARPPAGGSNVPGVAPGR